MCASLEALRSYDSFVYFLLYVDDLFIIAKEPSLNKQVEDSIFTGKFEMKDLDLAKSMEIHRDWQVCYLFMSQKNYIEKILKILQYAGI